MADQILFTAEKASIAAALSIVKDVVSHGNKIPILTHLLLDRSEDGGMIVVGSNLDQEIRATFNGSAGDTFEAFACPARTLADVIACTPTGEVSFIERRVSGRLEGIEISSGKYRTRLQTLPGSDFPSIGRNAKGSEVSLNSATLLRALKTVAWAAESNTQNFSQCGVHLDPTSTGMNVVATNRARLAMRNIPQIEFDQDEFKGIPAVTIPSAAIPTILKMLERSEDVSLHISDELVHVQAGNALLVTKLTDGQFLPYKALSPRDSGVTVKFSGAAMVEAVERVMKVNSDRSMPTVGIAVGASSVSIYIRQQTSGEAQDEIPAEASASYRQSFNGKNLTDAISRFGGDDIEFIIAAFNEPSFIRCGSDQLTTMMLAPVFVSWLNADDGVRT